MVANTLLLSYSKFNVVFHCLTFTFTERYLPKVFAAIAAKNAASYKKIDDDDHCEKDEEKLSENHCQNHKRWKSTEDVETVEEESFEGLANVWNPLFGRTLKEMMSRVVLGKFHDCHDCIGNLKVPCN